MARNTRTFSDLDLNFEPHPVTKDAPRKFDDNAIKASLRNLIFLNHYEAPFHSDKGSGLKELAFELPTPLLRTTMERVILDLVRNYEPRVRLNSVDIRMGTDSNSVGITINYNIINNPLPQTLSVVLERTR